MDDEIFSGRNSRRSVMKSLSGVDHSQSISQMDSNGDELDILKKQIEKQKQASMPLSLKMLPVIHSRQPSRGSLSMKSSEKSRVGTVDKYFTDINGNSLISTLGSSKDYFSNVSGGTSSRKKSFLSSNTNIGINAGNRVVFGEALSNIPTLPNGIQNILSSRDSIHSGRDGKFEIQKPNFFLASNFLLHHKNPQAEICYKLTNFPMIYYYDQNFKIFNYSA